MFKGFTERSLQTLTLAKEEARRFDQDYVGTEHLLLGLLREGKSVAPRALVSLGASLESVREQVGSIVSHGQQETSDGEFSFTTCSRRVLELAQREALQLGHDYIGTEHILLGLVRESEGVAVRVLSDLNVDPDEVRQEILRALGIDQEDPLDRVERR